MPSDFSTITQLEMHNKPGWQSALQALLESVAMQRCCGFAPDGAAEATGGVRSVPSLDHRLISINPPG